MAKLLEVKKEFVLQLSDEEAKSLYTILHNLHQECVYGVTTTDKCEINKKVTLLRHILKPHYEEIPF